MLHLADLGFKQISVEPVVAQPTDEYALKDSDLPVLFDEGMQIRGSPRSARRVSIILYL